MASGTGQVDQIISASAYKQIDDLLKRLMDVSDTIDAINTKSKGAESGIKGSGNLSSLNQSIRDAQAAMTALDDARKAFSAGLTDLGKVMADLSQKFGANSNIFQQTAQAVNNATNAVRDNNAANLQAANVALQVTANTAKYTQSTADLSAKLALQRLEMQEVNKNIKTLSDAIKANSGDVDTHKAKLGTWTERQAQLKLEIADTTSQLRSEIKEVVALTGSIDAMSQELFQMKEQYRALSKEERDNADIGGKLLGNIQKLDTEIKKLDATIGNHQRNVGNYNSATMAMSQILREAPAFANSLQTGLMGVSNNIPILIDEINRLRITNAELVASGQKAIPIWQTLGKSFLSFSNIITLALTAYLFYIQKFKKETDGATTSLDKFNQAIKDADAAMLANVGSEQAKLKMLTDIAKDVNASMQQRSKAVDELQSKYPDYFASLTKEKILQGDIAVALQKTNEEILNNAKAKAYASKVEAVYQQIVEKEEALKAFNKTSPASAGVGKDLIISGGTQPGSAQKAELIKQFQDRQKIYQEEIDKLKALAAEYQNQALTFAKGAGSLFLGGNSKSGVSKSAGAGANNALTNATYEAMKQRIEIEMEGNRQIYEDDAKTLEERKIALESYYNLTNDLAALNMKREIELSDNAISAAKKRLNTEKDLTADQRSAITKGIEAEEIKKQNAVRGYELATLANRRKFNDQLQNLEADNVQRQLNDIKAAEIELERTATDGYAKEILKAQKALEDKAITREQYNNLIEDIEQKHKDDLLRIEIQSDEEMLKVQGLSAEKQLQITQDKINKQNALAKGDKARKSATDPFAEDPIGGLYNNLFKNIAPDASEDARVKAAKKAADLTKQLAQETANAIIDIERNKFAQIQADLEKEGQTIERNKQREIDAVNASADYAVEKAQKIQEINAKAAAQQSELDAKKREENVKAARFDKAANIAKIIAATATAEVQALSYLANIATAPLYPVIAGLIAGVGAAQLAAAASAPIPAYKEGTNYHKGGPAIVGDGGERELITEPGGKQYWSGDKAELRYLPKGTTVKPESQLMQYAISRVALSGMAYPAADENAAKSIANSVEKSIKNIGENITDAIWQKKQNVTVTINSSERFYNEIKRM